MDREQFKQVLKLIGKKQKDVCADLGISSTAVSFWHSTGVYPKYFFYYLKSFTKDQEIERLKQVIKSNFSS